MIAMLCIYCCFVFSDEVKATTTATGLFSEANTKYESLMIGRKLIQPILVISQIQNEQKIEQIGGKKTNWYISKKYYRGMLYLDNIKSLESNIDMDQYV